MIVFDKYHYLDSGEVKKINDVSEFKEGEPYFSITKNGGNQINFKISKCVTVSNGLPFFDELYSSVDWKNYPLFLESNVKSKLINYGKENSFM